jgi:outer membrane lipoprotein SlyB
LEEKMTKCTISITLIGCLALSGCQSAATSQGGRSSEFGCIAGTVGGAVVGGVVGATIGSGTGQLWAVGGGATLGAAGGSALTC